MHAKYAIVLTILAIWTGAGLVRADDAVPPLPDKDVNVQAGGPMHEAFAQPFNPNPAPGPVVPKKPPATINELPPDQKPEGKAVQWISGYWAWDDDKKDFLWVSGVWRVPPPHRRWVPGSWTSAGEGWRWVAGFWAQDDRTDLPQLTPPPPSLDNGPSSPAPDDGSAYVPGLWIYRNTNYYWRPGYWLPYRDNWVWTPSCYYWTPAGCVYNAGYWDYDPVDRGVLFAPVSFDNQCWLNPGWSYRPWYALRSAYWLGNLFVRPWWGSYWYGNYYGNHWGGRGFYPWHSWGWRHHDAMFGHANWQHRHDRGWRNNLHNQFVGRRDGRLGVPPRNLAEHNARARAGTLNGNLRGLTPVNQMRGMTALTAQQRAQHTASIGKQRQFSSDRSQLRASQPLTNTAGKYRGNVVGKMNLPATGTRPTTSTASRNQSNLGMPRKVGTSTSGRSTASNSPARGNVNNNRGPSSLSRYMSNQGQTSRSTAQSYRPGNSSAYRQYGNSHYSYRPQSSTYRGMQSYANSSRNYSNRGYSPARSYSNAGRGYSGGRTFSSGSRGYSGGRSFSGGGSRGGGNRGGGRR